MSKWPKYQTGRHRLQVMLAQADQIDIDEGMLAYQRYHRVMLALSERFSVHPRRVCAAFCSLSPNSDYFGNLRSTVSVLDGIAKGKPAELITVSTYNHCKLRAIEYATGAKDFLRFTTGPKIRAFYMNILDPTDWQYVTIDGHMSAMWQDDPKMTMKEALLPLRVYKEVQAAVQQIAFENFMVPNQLQAALWFTRKRLSRVVYDPQLSLFADKTDVWKTLVDVADLHPYDDKKPGAPAQQEGMNFT